MNAATLALTLVVAVHSRSEGRAKLKLDESGLLDAKITLSTLDMPELCDIDLSNSDPAVRAERLGVLHACIEREIPQLLRVRADASTPCNVIVARSGVEKMVVSIDARAQCPAFPNERMTIDWGLFAGQPLDHVTVTTFEQPYADAKLVMLSKRSSKLVVDIAGPLWPKIAAGSAVVVLFAVALAIVVVKRRRRPPSGTGALACVVIAVTAGNVNAEGAADTTQPRFRVEQRIRVMEQHRADAEVCLVHMHGNEVNARDVMMELKDITCANAVWLDDARHPPEEKMRWGDDRIPVPNATMAAGKCTVNPNRILTPKHFAYRIDTDCEGDDLARRELRAFLDDKLLPAIERCRRGANGPLPVVAFHNNTNLTARDMDARVSTTVKERKHDILFVTKKDDYDRLASLQQWTIALQSMPPANDGSLSVLLQNERYINVEAQIAPHNKPVNRAMAEAALRSVGGWQCGPGDWPAPAAPSPSPSP